MNSHRGSEKMTDTKTQATKNITFAENCARAQKALDAVPNEAELQIFLAGIEIERLSDPAITKVLHWLMDIAGLPGVGTLAVGR